MFVRVKTCSRWGARTGTCRYLQIVENARENGRVRQRVIGNLGRLDELLASGDLERVITQMVERCPSVQLVLAAAEGSLAVESDLVWGPVLVFERLWEELGLKALLADVGK